MTTVAIDGETIRISLQGMDKVWALKGGLTIPLAAVRSVSVASADLKPRGIRAPGTAVPGHYLAGTWRGKGSKEFWHIHKGAPALVLDLDGNEYARVVVEVADPTAVVAEIERARDAAAAGVAADQVID